jgi:hypothetical protein
MESMADDYAYSNADDDSTGIIVAKCFMHGAAFVYLMVVLLVAWIFVALMIAVRIVPGVQLGALSILSIIIANFAIMFIAVGWLNAQVSQHVWKVQVKQKWRSLLGHGFLLSIVIAIAGIPFMIINSMMLSADLWTYVEFLIVSFLIHSSIIGYFCKRIAEVFTDDALTTRIGSMNVLDRTTSRGQCFHC